MNARRPASRQRTASVTARVSQPDNHGGPQSHEPAGCSDWNADLAMVKSWMEQERAARGQLQREQRQFLQELHGLAAAIENRVAHVELQAATRCVELVGPGVQQAQQAHQEAMLTRKEVEAMAERAAGRIADRAADCAVRHAEESLRELRVDVDKWRQEHVVVMAEFVALQGKVAACGERTERVCHVAAVWDSAMGSLRALLNGLGPALDSTDEQLKRMGEISTEVQTLHQAVASTPSIQDLREEVGQQQQQMAERCSQLEGTLDMLSRSLASAFAKRGGAGGSTFVAPRPQPAASSRCTASPRGASAEGRRPMSARGHIQRSPFGPSATTAQPLQPEAFCAAPPQTTVSGVVPMSGSTALQQAGQVLYPCCGGIAGINGGMHWEALMGGAGLLGGLAGSVAEEGVAGESCQKPLLSSPRPRPNAAALARASLIHQRQPGRTPGTVGQVSFSD